MRSGNRMGRGGSRAVAALVLLVAAAAPAAAQVPQTRDGSSVYVTREVLQDMLGQLEESASSRAYSERIRERARWEAALIRARLEEGDFQVGDRVLLMVEDHAELSDTFTVATGRVLNLPAVGAISLAGVLRSELEEHLRSELGRFLRSPVVHSRSMIRISITGEVANQGYFVVPTEAVVSDALMLAGGPTREARLDGIRIERGRERVWDGEAMARAISEGRTLDQLNLRAGDQIVVPEQSRRDSMELLRSLTMIIPTVVLLATLIF